MEVAGCSDDSRGSERGDPLTSASACSESWASVRLTRSDSEASSPWTNLASHLGQHSVRSDSNSPQSGNSGGGGGGGGVNNASRGALQTVHPGTPISIFVDHSSRAGFHRTGLVTTWLRQHASQVSAIAAGGPRDGTQLRRCRSMDLTSYKQLRLHDRSPPTDLSDESSSSPSLSNFICDNPRYRPGFAGSRASPLSTSSENGSSIASDVLLPLITSSQSPPPSILSRVSVTDTATSTSLACRNDSDGSPARSAHPRNISTASDYHTTPAIELDNPRIRRNQQHSPGGSALASSSRPAGSVSPLHYQASPPRAPRPWFNPHVVDFGPMPVLQLLRMSSHKITTSSSVTVDANANSRAASRDEHHNTSWWLSIKGRVDAFFDDNILVG